MFCTAIREHVANGFDFPLGLKLFDKQALS